jgi:hypothetical protein
LLACVAAGVWAASRHDGRLYEGSRLLALLRLQAVPANAVALLLR